MKLYLPNIALFLSSVIFYCYLLDFAISDGHSCDRECEWPPSPRTCTFDFKIEWYYTMSRACYNCPYNASDCMRPHCIPADGMNRPVISVNRDLHPSIRVCHNDTVVVNVVNKLDNNEGVSLHWHGVYQKGSPYMDGVPMLTQCPIPAKTSFRYTFRANPPGTHWWHAHSGLQRSDGLAGPFIINRALHDDPQADLYDVDSKDYVLFITDWMHDLTLTRFMASHHLTGGEIGDSILINGRGVHRTFTDPVTNATFQLARLVYEVEQNKRYRFRFISAAGNQCPFKISVEGHNLTLIASDGADIEPYLLTALEIHGGERHDLVLNAFKPISNYWMRIEGVGACRNIQNNAIIRYNGAPEEYPTSPMKEDVPANLNSVARPEADGHVYFSSLKPVYSQAYPLDSRYQGTPDKALFVGMQLRRLNNNPLVYNSELYPIEDFLDDGDPVTIGQMNNITFETPGYPILTQPEFINETEICDPDSNDWNEKKSRFCDGDFCECPYIVDVEVGSLVELIIYDIGEENIAGHPMHLHGQHFAVVAMGKLGDKLPRHKIEELYSNGRIQRNFDAVLKDSLAIPDGGYAVVRFLADNPGVWFFHCHQLFHSITGMDMAFRVGRSSDWIKAPDDFPKCGNWPNSYKSSASGYMGIEYHSVFLIFMALLFFSKLTS